MRSRTANARRNRTRDRARERRPEVAPQPAAEPRAHVPEIEAAPTPSVAPCHAEDLAPEPQPIECLTCCTPVAPALLAYCETPACTYYQCAECVIRGDGGCCARVGCWELHQCCPQCREQVTCGSLTVKDLPADLLLLALDKNRKRARAHVEAVVDKLDDTMDSFMREMASVRRAAFSVSTGGMQP